MKKSMDLRIPVVSDKGRKDPWFGHPNLDEPMEGAGAPTIKLYDGGTKPYPILATKTGGYELTVSGDQRKYLIEGTSIQYEYIEEEETLEGSAVISSVTFESEITTVSLLELEGSIPLPAGLTRILPWIDIPSWGPPLGEIQIWNGSFSGGWYLDNNSFVTQYNWLSNLSTLTEATIDTEYGDENSDRWKRKPLGIIQYEDEEEDFYERWSFMDHEPSVNDSRFNIRVQLKSSSSNVKMEASPDLMMDEEEKKVREYNPGDLVPEKEPGTMEFSVDSGQLFLRVSEHGTRSYYTYISSLGEQDGDGNFDENSGKPTQRIDYLDIDSLFFASFDTSDDVNFKITTTSDFNGDEVNGKIIPLFSNCDVEIYYMPRQWCYYGRHRTTTLSPEPENHRIAAWQNIISMPHTITNTYYIGFWYDRWPHYINIRNPYPPYDDENPDRELKRKTVRIESTKFPIPNLLMAIPTYSGVEGQTGYYGSPSELTLDEIGSPLITLCPTETIEYYTWGGPYLISPPERIPKRTYRIVTQEGELTAYTPLISNCFVSTSDWNRYWKQVTTPDLTSGFSIFTDFRLIGDQSRDEIIDQFKIDHVGDYPTEQELNDAANDLFPCGVNGLHGITINPERCRFGILMGGGYGPNSEKYGAEYGLTFDGKNFRTLYKDNSWATGYSYDLRDYPCWPYTEETDYSYELNDIWSSIWNKIELSEFWTTYGPSGKSESEYWDRLDMFPYGIALAQQKAGSLIAIVRIKSKVFYIWRRIDENLIVRPIENPNGVSRHGMSQDDQEIEIPQYDGHEVFFETEFNRCGGLTYYSNFKNDEGLIGFGYNFESDFVPQSKCSTNEKQWRKLTHYASYPITTEITEEVNPSSEWSYTPPPGPEEFICTTSYYETVQPRKGISRSDDYRGLYSLDTPIVIIGTRERATKEPNEFPTIFYDGSYRWAGDSPSYIWRTHRAPLSILFWTSNLRDVVSTYPGLTKSQRNIY